MVVEAPPHNCISDHTSHIPKVVTQHGLFLPSKDTPIITKKPCEQKSHNRVYYSTESKTERYNYADHQSNMLSTYADNYSSTTKPEHYKNPRKPIIPSSLLFQKNATNNAKNAQNATAIKNYWNSMYKSTFSEEKKLKSACTEYKRLRGPPFSVAHPPLCLSDEQSMTFYASDYGMLGSNPTDKLVIPAFTYNNRIPAPEKGWTRVIEVKEIADDTIMKKVGDVIDDGRTQERPDLKTVDRLPTVKHDLTRGTTRATFHIPGYAGFLPANTNNPRCAEIEAGLKDRKSWSNISEQYHLNLPGYSGHIPQSAINDKGTRQITMMTVMGRDYARNAGIDKNSMKI